MSSPLCPSEALDRLVEPWAAKIVKSSGTTVEAILTHAENVRAALHALEPHGPKARQVLAARSGLSRPTMSKLETIGRHALPLRPRAGFLPPSVRSLYALARKPAPEFEQALTMDLRSHSCAEIEALFAPSSSRKPPRKLMTILVPPDLDEAARRVLIADIEAALARIAESRKVDLDVSSPASGAKVEQQASPPPGRRRDEGPTGPSHEAADKKPMDLEEHAAHYIAGGQRPCFFTGENPLERQDLTARRNLSPDSGHGPGPSHVRGLERSEPSPRGSAISVLLREREEFLRRLARLENSPMRQPSRELHLPSAFFA